MEKSNARKTSDRDESLIRYFGEISGIPLLSSQEEIGRIRILTIVHYTSRDVKLSLHKTSYLKGAS